MLTVPFYSSLSSETTTKTTPWSPDYISESRQPFISGGSRPQTDGIDGKAQAGIPQLTGTLAVEISQGGAVIL